MKNKLLVFMAMVTLGASGAHADWRATATNLTWFVVKPTADMAQLRDALLARYDGLPLDGLLATAARASITLTDVGSGNSELAITLPLSAGNSWVTALTAVPCPTANTTALRRACADMLVKADLLRLWRLWRILQREQANPIVEPPPL